MLTARDSAPKPQNPKTPKPPKLFNVGEFNYLKAYLYLFRYSLKNKMLNLETAKKKKDQIKVRGTVVQDFEMSRVSQSYTKSVKLPESTKNSLKPES